MRPIAPEYTHFAKFYGWYKIIADLSDNKVYDFDRITSLPASQVFTFLQYRRDKEIADDAQRRADAFYQRITKK